jgi:hypothetical protein
MDSICLMNFPNWNFLGTTYGPQNLTRSLPMNSSSVESSCVSQTDGKPNTQSPPTQTADSPDFGYPGPLWTSDFQLPVPIFRILMIFFIPLGICSAIAGCYHWTTEQYYHAEGIQTDSAVVTKKWTRISSNEGGGNYTIYYLRYTYSDFSERSHTHQLSTSYGKWPQLGTWDELPVGARLPTIEYLTSAPGTHRFAFENGQGKVFLIFGLILLLASIPLHLLHKAVSR